MKNKKLLPVIMAAVAIVSLIGAILLFAVALPLANAGYKRVLEVIIAILMLLMAGFIGLYLLLTRDSDPNFFLFDRAKKKNVPVEQLSFTTVNERMNIYLGMVCKKIEELWQGDVFESERKLGYRRVYRPLLAYKMLYDLAEKDLDAYWALLLNASNDTVEAICSALEQGGEREMVKAFRFLMANYRTKPEKVKDFVIGNAKYIRGRMMSYIKKNIEFFY